MADSPRYETFHRANDGQQISSTVSFEHQEQINEGGFGKIHRVFIKIHDLLTGEEQSTAESLIYKELKDEGWQDITVDEVIQIYEYIKSLKDPRLQVPNTFQKVTKEGNETGILMSDLSENGKNFVVSTNEIGHDDLEDRTRDLKEIVEKHPEYGRMLRDLNITELTQRLAESAEAATEHGMYLYEDIPFVVLKPSGEFEIILADLEKAGTDTSRFRDKLEQLNYQSMQRVTEMFIWAKGYVGKLLNGEIGST